jgi:hypothetical protein
VSCAAFRKTAASFLFLNSSLLSQLYRPAPPCWRPPPSPHAQQSEIQACNAGEILVAARADNLSESTSTDANGTPIVTACAQPRPQPTAFRPFGDQPLQCPSGMFLIGTQVQDPSQATAVDQDGNSFFVSCARGHAPLAPAPEVRPSWSGSYRSALASFGAGRGDATGDSGDVRDALSSLQRRPDSSGMHGSQDSSVKAGNFKRRSRFASVNSSANGGSILKRRFNKASSKGNTGGKADRVVQRRVADNGAISPRSRFNSTQSGRARPQSQGSSAEPRSAGFGGFGSGVLGLVLGFGGGFGHH